LFSHVCFLDINESLDLAVKWREIRLEEAGFPSMETSSRFLIAQDLNKLSNDFSHPQIPIAESDHFNTYFLESWVESVEMKLSSVPPEDFQFWETVTQVIGHGKDVVSLLQVNNHTQVNNHNDLLEEINSNDSLKEQFINSLINDYVSTYYDLLSPITLMNNHSLNEELIVFKILKHLLLTHNRNSLIQYEIQFLHIINGLKISLSDFEFFSIQKCQTFTISTINLGIEYLLNKNSLSGNFDSQLSESMFWVKSKGFTQLFQLGWSLLSDMRYRLALQVQANLESSDTSSLTHIVFKEDLKAIIKHNKFKLLEKFVMSRLSKSSPSLEHAILGLIAPMPGVSSVILSETNQVSGFYNDISIVNHLNLVQNFIDNLIYNKES